MAQPTNPALWVVLADGAHGHVLTPDAVEGRFATVSELRAPGTTRAHGGHDASHTLAHADKAEFIKALAHLIDTAVRERKVGQLVLIAPAHALGDLRNAIGHAAAALVVGSESKDLVKLGIRERDEHLARWWLAPAAVG